MTTMKVVKFLGKGTFGSVDLVRFIQPDGTFEYSARKSSYWDTSDTLIREFQILSKFRGCPEIVQCSWNTLHEDFTTDGHKICSMFMEYAAEGTIESLMDEYADRRLPDHMVRLFTRRILQGLVSIHSKGYIHCDLKPANVLVFPNYTYKNGGRYLKYEVKITDFGLVRRKEQKDDWWEPDRPFWGTPLYMSPESVNEGRIGEALDIWSLGCVILEMYTGRSPWPVETKEELAVAFWMDSAPEIPETLPWDARMFLETCFARNPQERLSALCLLWHPFIFNEDITSDIPRGLSFIRVAEDHRQSHQQPQRKPLKLRVCHRVPPGFERLAASRWLRHPFVFELEKTSSDVPWGLPFLKAADDRQQLHQEPETRPLELRVKPSVPPGFDIAVN